MNGIRTYELCDTGEVLYQLSTGIAEVMSSNPVLNFFQALITQLLRFCA